MTTEATINALCRRYHVPGNPYLNRNDLRQSLWLKALTLGDRSPPYMYIALKREVASLYRKHYRQEAANGEFLEDAHCRADNTYREIEVQHDVDAVVHRLSVSKAVVLRHLVVEIQGNEKSPKRRTAVALSVWPSAVTRAVAAARGVAIGLEE